jgi:hypothetical protein
MGNHEFHIGLRVSDASDFPANLSHKVEIHFDTTASRILMNSVRKGLRFKYQPPRHAHNLDELGLIEDQEDKPDSFGWTFQQNEARCHTLQASLDWLEENINVMVDWLANSPDLSTA